MLHGMLCGSKQVGAVFVCPIRDCSHLPHCHCIVPVVSVYLICIARQRQTAETVSTLSALLAPGSRKSGIRAWFQVVLYSDSKSSSHQPTKINIVRRPWFYPLSFGTGALHIILYLNIFWDCWKSGTLKWISDYPHLMGLILTDDQRLEMDKKCWSGLTAWNTADTCSTLSPVSPLL